MEVQSWTKEFDVLLTFMEYPSSIRNVIYTNNTIERTIKEIRKHLKPMNSLSSLEVDEKNRVFDALRLYREVGRTEIKRFSEAHEAC
jgi:putative transposase